MAFSTVFDLMIHVECRVIGIKQEQSKAGLQEIKNVIDVELEYTPVMMGSGDLHMLLTFYEVLESHW